MYGMYETIALGSNFRVKQIVVTPGGRLSLQNNVHRAERLVVVANTARVTIDNDVKLLSVHSNDTLSSDYGAPDHLSFDAA